MARLGQLTLNVQNRTTDPTMGNGSFEPGVAEAVGVGAEVGVEAEAGTDAEAGEKVCGIVH